MTTDSELRRLASSLDWLLTPAAAELYARLVLQPDGVDPSTAHTDELVDAGLARLTSQDGELLAVPPHLGLARAFQREADRWLRLAPRFEALVEALEEIPTNTGQEPARLLERELPSPAERELETELMISRAKFEVLQLQPMYEEESGDEAAEGWSPFPDENTPAGVRCRSVYDERLLLIPGFEDMLDVELGFGAEIRFTNRPLSSYLLVVDERIAGYSPRPGGPGRVTEAPGLVGLLTTAFDGAWNRAVPYRRSTGLSGAQRKVLTLVGLGNNNRTIATALGCHERTVRRRIDELLDHFGEVERPSLVRHAMLTGDEP